MRLDALWEWLLNAWIVGEVVIAVAARTRRGQGNVQDRGTQIMIWVVIVASFFAGGWVKGYRAADMPFNPHGLRLAGLALLAAGLVMRIAAIVTLGRSFSANVAIRSAQTLQRKGLYRLIRHPSYLGMEMIFLAGLHAHNWACLTILMVFPTLAVLYRIQVEETALLSAFGDGYADYMRTTKRLLPGIY